MARDQKILFGIRLRGFLLGWIDTRPKRIS